MTTPDAGLAGRLREMAAAHRESAVDAGRDAAEWIRYGAVESAGDRAWAAATLGRRALDLLSAASALEHLEAIIKIERNATLHNNLCQDHYDKVSGLPCLLCERERLASALEQAQRTCKTCADKGRRRDYRAFCWRHERPCADLGNTCGRWQARPDAGEGE